MRFRHIACGIAAMIVLATAHAASVSRLVGSPVQDRNGRGVGKVNDLIMDVRAGEVLYVIVEAQENFYTLPVRAFDDQLRLNMALANGVARGTSTDDPKYRRAARLIGQPITHPGSGETVGTIADIEFNAKSGKVGQVVVNTGEGLRHLPPGVLAAGRFPPLTQWQVENPSTGGSTDPGFVRRPPSQERQRLHDPQWDRRE